MQNKNIAGLTAAVCLITSLSVSAPAIADIDGGAFIGGMVAGRVIRNMNDRTEAEQDQAYYAQQQAEAAQRQPVQQAAPAAPEESIEQRLARLDKLAEGGYITPEEYQRKRTAILDDV